MVDMARTIIPKSDQLNADDLIAGPRSILITRVVEHHNSDQPISIHFEGDNGKPYKPCKGMRRALVYVWGPDGDEYVGRGLTLFHDPNVTWGGEKVGGIRISHMSGITETTTFPLSTSKTKRIPWTIEPLAMPRQRRPLPDMVAGYEAVVAKAETLEDLVDITGGENAGRLRERIKAEGGDNADALLERMTQAGSKRHSELAGNQDDSTDAPDDDPDGLGMYGVEAGEESPFDDAGQTE